MTANPGPGRPPRVIIIVPARLASTRLPQKVLLARTGTPMVQHVVAQALTAACVAGDLSRVVVATDSPRIADALAPYGTRCILTSPDHPNGTSRLAEAAEILGLSGSDIVVNAQGDEPEMPGTVIDAAVRALLYRNEHGIETAVGTVCTPMGPGEDPANPNIVKVVRALAAARGGFSGRGEVSPSGQPHSGPLDHDGRLAPALYFTRAAVPFHRGPAAALDLASAPDLAAQPMRHVGVYAYRVGFLKAYISAPPTPLEQAESLEQLRILEHGLTIGVARCDAARGLTGIDIPEQYDAFVARHARGV